MKHDVATPCYLRVRALNNDGGKNYSPWSDPLMCETSGVESIEYLGNFCADVTQLIFMVENTTQYENCEIKMLSKENNLSIKYNTDIINAAQRELSMLKTKQGALHGCAYEMLEAREQCQSIITALPEIYNSTIDALEADIQNWIRQDDSSGGATTIEEDDSCDSGVKKDETSKSIA